MSRPEGPGDLMTVAEFGRRIGRSRVAAWRRVRDGEIEAINIGSALRPQLRISEAEYARYAERRLVAAL